MSDPQYDSIASQYHSVALDRADRRHLFVPTVTRALGDISERTAIDFATGSGYWARFLKDLGATDVLGVDVSSRMIEIAEQDERRMARGIRYLVADVADMPSIVSADVGFAGFLLNYAETSENLLALCRGIWGNITPGGRLVTLTPNPDHPEFDGRERYDCLVEAPDGMYEGCRIRVTDYHETLPPVSFCHFWYSKATYEAALAEAGFRDVVWHPLIVSQEGIDRFPPGFWDRYLEASNPCVLEARRA